MRSSKSVFFSPHPPFAPGRAQPPDAAAKLHELALFEIYDAFRLPLLCVIWGQGRIDQVREKFGKVLVGPIGFIMLDVDPDDRIF